MRSFSRPRRGFARPRRPDRTPPRTEPLEGRRLLAADGFGDDGWSTLAIGPGIPADVKDLHRQADGKFVAVFSVYPPQDHTSTAPAPHRDFGVARFNADGTLDTTFGGDGVVFTDVGDKTTDHPNAVTVQPDGKVIVVGLFHGPLFGPPIDFRPAILRYNPDGGLDATFGDGGKVLGAEGDERDAATAVALDGQGRILVGADRRTQRGGHSTTAYDPGVWRYNPDGTLDTSFGENGRRVLGTSTAGGRVQALLVQPGDGVLVGAHAYANHGPSNAAEAGVLYLAKLDAAGRFDPAFGANGEVATPRIGENLEDVAQLPDGRIAVAGSRRAPQDPDSPMVIRSRGLLAAYLANGTPDTSFGDNGVTLIGDEAGMLRLHDLAVDAQGRILTSGIDLTRVIAREEGAAGVTFLSRFNPAGQPDAAFGTGGSIRFGDGRSQGANAWHVVPTPDGILAGGTYARTSSDPRKLFIARFGPDGAGDTTPPAEDPPAVEAPDFSSTPPEYDRVYTEPPPGWTVNFSLHSYNMAGVWLHGPDTDDTVRITRNPTLPAAIDLDINGHVMTINFHAGPRLSWGISAGGGNDRIDVLLGTGSGFAGGGQLYGGDGNDVLVNGDFGTLMVGGPGDDILVGGKGNDTLWGDDGVDRLYGGEGDDRLSTGMVSHPGHGTSPYARVLEGEIYDGGPGNDVFLSGGQAEELPDLDPPPVPPIDIPRPPADPRVPFETPTPPGMNVSYHADPTGHSANVRVETTGGDDAVRLTRNTTLRNGIDVDVNGNVLTIDLDVSPAISLSVHTLAGNDRVTVNLGGWFSTASRGLHVVTGEGDDEVTNQGDYGFIINGDTGNDTLRGGPGGEYLMGGPGVDKLYGGGGNDTLHVGYIEVSPTGPAPVEEGEVYDPGEGRDVVITGEGETRYHNGEPVDGESQAGSDEFQARFTGKATVRRGKAYTFTVTYAAPFGDVVDRSSVGDGDLTVTGPGGFSAAAQLVGAKAKQKGSVLVARYRVAAPGGTFDAADNGTYTVSVGAGAVNTLAGRAASAVSITVPGGRATGTAAADLGSFVVAARTRSRRGGPPGATDIVRFPVP